ncbi:MAG TPA: hypothetical protein VG963_29260, partial [Polyangiaceae bacterium]|nr:hypothetical protein [Polyangiaceae bacterium]
RGDLDAGTDASALSGEHDPSHGSGSLAHPPTKVQIPPHPEEHHPASSVGDDSSVPDASHSATKVAAHH